MEVRCRGAWVPVIVSDKKQGKSNRRPALETLSLFLLSLKIAPSPHVLSLHPYLLCLWFARSCSPAIPSEILPPPSCHPSPVNWLHSWLDWISCGPYIWHCSSEQASATNSLLIYVMTAERETVLSPAHWRRWERRHARMHNMRRYHIAGKSYNQNQINSNPVITRTKKYYP